MAQERTVVIDGFAFHSRKEAQIAQKELDGVNYLKERMEGQDPEKVLEFYHKMLDEGVFETPIGISFEKEIRDKLLETPGITEDRVRPVDVREKPQATVVKPTESTNTNEKKKKKSTAQFVSVVLNVVLILLVIGMFYLVKSSNNVNILNYENELVNKYENWQMELEDKEAELDAREAALESAGK